MPKHRVRDGVELLFHLRILPCQADSIGVRKIGCLFSGLSLFLRLNRIRRQSTRSSLPGAREETRQLTLLTPYARACIHCAVTYAEKRNTSKRKEGSQPLVDGKGLMPHDYSITGL